MYLTRFGRLGRGSWEQKSFEVLYPPLPTPPLMFLFKAGERTQLGSDPTACGPPWACWGLPPVMPNPVCSDRGLQVREGRAALVAALLPPQPPTLEGCQAHHLYPTARGLHCQLRNQFPTHSCAGNLPAPQTASYNRISFARFMAGNLWPSLATSITPYSR